MNEREKNQKQTLLDIAYYVAIGGLIYFALRYAVAWLLPFFLGVAAAALLRPSTLKLSRRLHMSERWAGGIVLFFFYLSAVAVIGLFLTIVLAQLYELLARLPEIYTQSIAPVIERVSDWFYGLAARFLPEAGSDLGSFGDAVSQAVQKAAVDGSAHFVGWAAGFAAKLPMMILALVFTIVISLLTATRYREVTGFLRGMVPPRLAPHLHGLQTFLRETIWQYLRAYTIIMAITFVELGAGLWLLGFAYVLPIAAAITLLDILPLIGSGIILVPWGIMLFASGDTTGGFGLLMLFGVVAVVRNIIEPRIVGGQIGLHPIATITAMYAGLKIAGVAGMFAMPVLVLLAKHFLWDEKK